MAKPPTGRLKEAPLCYLRIYWWPTKGLSVHAEEATPPAAGRPGGARTKEKVAGEHTRTFLVLDLGLDVGDGVAALDLQRHRLPRQRLHEDLHLAGARGLLAGGMGFLREWVGWGGVAELPVCGA